jgi:hypothetical protein
LSVVQLVARNSSPFDDQNKTYEAQLKVTIAAIRTRVGIVLENEMQRS